MGLIARIRTRLAPDNSEAVKAAFWAGVRATKSKPQGHVPPNLSPDERAAFRAGQDSQA